MIYKERNIIFIVSLILLITVFFGLSVYAKKARKNTNIQKINVTIESSDNEFVNEDTIKEIFDGEIDSINTVLAKELDLIAVENLVKQNPFVKDCDAFINHRNELCFNVLQKEPLFRVMNSSSVNYYISKDGEKFPKSTTYTANVPVVRGNFNYQLDSLGIQKDITVNNLLSFFEYVDTNETAKSLVSSVNVRPNGDITFVPRTGEHIVIIGEPNQLDEKFNRLFIFYKEGLSNVGWNKYSSINLKYNQQIIAKKK